MDPLSSEVLQELGAAELRKRHQHDAEFGKALECPGGSFAEKSVPSENTSKTGLFGCFHQRAVGETAPPSVAGAVRHNSKLAEERAELLR